VVVARRLVMLFLLPLMVAVSGCGGKRPAVAKTLGASSSCADFLKASWQAQYDAVAQAASTPR
jgi:hypothetical protein